MLDRELMAIEFRKEYESLCTKYDMEIAMFDKWGDDHYELLIYDKKEGIFIDE